MDAWIALRNAVGITVPLAIGVASGMARPGLAMASGALQVSFSDGHDPYLRRLKRMLASCLLCASAVTIGGLIGQHHWLAIVVLGVWAFFTGLVVVLGPAAESLGIVSLVMLIIYVAQPLTPQQAMVSGALALGGGLLQTALSLAPWPFRRYEPERSALANLYQELARVATSLAGAGSAPPASALFTQAQQTLAELGDDHSSEGERYWSLLNQAERIRVNILTLRRSPDRRFLELTTVVLQAIARSLTLLEPPAEAAGKLAELEALADREGETFRFQAAALVGQLRSSLRTTSENHAAAVPGGAAQPWQRRFRSSLARLQANLSLQSSACRHAIRMAACLAIGEVAAWNVQSQRSYWLAMTVVLVLKPDFSVTFIRGVLRIAGTVLGLLLATALFHLIPAKVAAEVALAGVFAFLLRWLGAGNYGAFTIAVSALVVLLFAIRGQAPKEVILIRGEMTMLGGLIALAAYLLWPTWERTQVTEVMASMLDAYRAYFHMVVRAPDSPEINQVRLAARLARSNLEASVDRLRSEPGTPEAESLLWQAMLASSHRFIAGAMALETVALGTMPEFCKFAGDVETALLLVCGVLRGTAGPAKFPDLRQDYRQIPATVEPLVREETDRMTNALNTLWEQVKHKQIDVLDSRSQ